MSERPDRAHPKTAPVDRLSLIWCRVHEHKVVQWSVGYVALAYAIQHGLILTSESFEWPNAVARVSMLLLALGLPLVVTFAWYHGARASRNFSQAELSILAALLVMSSLPFYVFVRPVPEAAPAAQQASIAAIRRASESPKGSISLAVLPFLNLSSDKEQEFFADGMTEEITAALAKVPDLRVVGRTSAFQFKGENKDLRAIGEALSATHLIEGSVRKAGNRVRITAQLIRADDGTHIWAEDYDRELSDVFATQEDIARAITTSLHMTLALKPGENLVNNRNIDSESYEKFLRAKALWEGRGGEATPAQGIPNLTEAISLFQSVIAKNPGYAPAWAYLSSAYLNLGGRILGTGDIADARIRADEIRVEGEEASRKAAQLDPGLSLADTNLGWQIRSRGKLLEAEPLIQKALQLDPTEPNAIFVNSMFALAAGRLKEGLDFAERGHALDPFYPNAVGFTVDARWVNGQIDSAIALTKTLRPVPRATQLALIYASIGHYGDAADQLMELAAGNPNSDAAQAARLLRALPAKPAPGRLPRLRPGLDMLYLYLGAPERALGTYEYQAEVPFIIGEKANIWLPAYAAVRKTKRFKTLMRKAGLVEYWRAKGWPPQCHPTIGDDFECS